MIGYQDSMVPEFLTQVYYPSIVLPGGGAWTQEPNAV